MSAPVIGASVGDRKVAKWQAALDGLLADDELVLGMFKLTKLRPLVSALVITNARILGVEPTSGSPISIEAFRANVAGVHFNAGVNLRVTVTSGEEIRFGSVKKADIPAIESALERGGYATTAASAVAALEEAVPDAALQRAQLDAMVRGQNLWDKQAEEILAQCRGDDLPVFVIGAGNAGALAAYQDRCIIVKKGGLSGFMAGATFGGRVTTFYYADITGIEYNAGMLSGVLEILTPSYQGTANKDFWRGTTRGRNADSNDPWTLSNTLPLQKSAYNSVRAEIDMLNQMVTEAKRPAPVVQLAEPQGAASLGDELSKLAQLHTQGILDDEEFRAAKAALIARMNA